MVYCWTFWNQHGDSICFNNFAFCFILCAIYYLLQKEIRLNRIAKSAAALLSLPERNREMKEKGASVHVIGGSREWSVTEVRVSILFAYFEEIWSRYTGWTAPCSAAFRKRRPPFQYFRSKTDYVNGGSQSLRRGQYSAFVLVALASDTPSGVTIIIRHRNSRPGLANLGGYSIA